MFALLAHELYRWQLVVTMEYTPAIISTHRHTTKGALARASFSTQHTIFLNASTVSVQPELFHYMQVCWVQTPLQSDVFDKVSTLFRPGTRNSDQSAAGAMTAAVFTMISTQTQFQVYRLLACLRTGDTQGTTTWRTHHVSRVVADRLHAQLLGVAVRFLALCRHQSTRVGQNAGCMQAMRVACVPSPVPETVMWYSSTIPCTSGAIVAHLQVMCAEAAHCRRNIGTLASPRQSV